MLAAGLNWREVAVLRSYAHYLRQIGTPYTQGYVEQVLARTRGCHATWPGCSQVQFDPDRYAAPTTARRAGGGRPTVAADITAALDAVTSLDADRILRTLLSLITATSRTNAYRLDATGDRREFLSVKLDPHRVPACPNLFRRMRSGCTRRGSRGCTCGSATSPAVACAGRTGRRISGPRSSAWSRPRR